MDKELVLYIENKIGLKFKNKQRIYTSLLSERYVKDGDNRKSKLYNKYILKLGESLLNLIKAEYIFMNITTDFETLRYIDSRTKKAIRNNMNISLDIITCIKKHNDIDKYNVNQYYIIKMILGIIYIENNYEIAKEVIISDVENIISRYIKEPKYDWYRIIKDWSLYNSVELEFNHIDKKSFDNNMIGVSLKISDKQLIGYPYVLG